jgi:hypothetical protein
LHHEKNIDRLSPMELDATFDHFRSYRAQVAWICHSRSDLCIFVARAARVTAEKFYHSDIQELNSAILYLKRTLDLKLSCPRLDFESLHMATFSDSSFSNNTDLSMQIRCVVLLCDAIGNRSFLSYRSLKDRRVVCPSAAGERKAFSEAFDAAVVLCADLEQIFDKKTPLVMLTDSDSLYSLFGTVTRNRCTREKRLLLDMYPVKKPAIKGSLTTSGLSPHRETSPTP